MSWSQNVVNNGYPFRSVVDNVSNVIKIILYVDTYFQLGMCLVSFFIVL